MKRSKVPNTRRWHRSGSLPEGGSTSTRALTFTLNEPPLRLSYSRDTKELRTDIGASHRSSPRKWPSFGVGSIRRARKAPIRGQMLAIVPKFGESSPHQFGSGKLFSKID
jgi:hypothetical protein